MLDLALTGPLVDHHCHGLVRRELDRDAFESLLNEGSGAGHLGTSAFDSMLGLAVRRWCAPLLDLPALCDCADYLTRRAELGSTEVDRRFLRAADVSDLVVDTGFEPEPLSSPHDLAQLAGGRAHEVIRLETLAQDLLASGVDADGLPGRVVEALRSSGAVGAKTIAAYRVGLELSARKPDEEAVCAVLGSLRPADDDTFRIADPTVTSWLAWAAIEAGLPLQVHVGYGDADIDLHRCDPLLLTRFLRGTRERGVPVLLLHNYPFHRHASYLAQVFDHVFIDLSLTVHNTGALSRRVIEETLELVPFGKLLYASDACGLSELFYLGSLLFRRGLSGCLNQLIGSGDMGLEDAQRLALQVGSGNARRVYDLRTQLSG